MGNYPHIWSKGWLLPVHWIRLFVCNQGAFADNLTDAVEGLLIKLGFSKKKHKKTHTQKKKKKKKKKHNQSRECMHYITLDFTFSHLYPCPSSCILLGTFLETILSNCTNPLKYILVWTSMIFFQGTNNRYFPFSIILTYFNFCSSKAISEEKDGKSSGESREVREKEFDTLQVLSTSHNLSVQDSTL